jgi:hypothetical protein
MSRIHSRDLEVLIKKSYWEMTTRKGLEMLWRVGRVIKKGECFTFVFHVILKRRTPFLKGNQAFASKRGWA